MISSFATFDWDRGNWPKCGKHGLSQDEIEQVFEGQISVYPDKAPGPAEQRFNAVGKTYEGRHVFVVFTFRNRQGERLIRPISARFMHLKEIQQYEIQTRT